MKGVISSLVIATIILSQYGCRKLTTLNIVSPSKFDKMINKEANPQIIDIRPIEQFNQEHIKSALNIDPKTLDFEKKLMQAFNFAKPTFIYCDNGDISTKVAPKVENMGFNSVYILEGGFKNWKKANKPIEVGPPPQRETGMTMDDLNAKINIDKDIYVLVNYGSARWGEANMKLIPVLDKIAKERKDKVILVKVDLNDDYRVTEKKNLPGVPFTELYLKGKLIWSHKGYMEEDDILKETNL